MNISKIILKIDQFIFLSMPYMQIETIKTPSLIVDFGRMKRNSERMTAHAKSLNVALRPHVKTHRSLEIARLQTAGYAGGIMVSTLAEAEACAEAGIIDILYAVVDPRIRYF